MDTKVQCIMMIRCQLRTCTHIKGYTSKYNAHELQSADYSHNENILQAHNIICTCISVDLHIYILHCRFTMDTCTVYTGSTVQCKVYIRCQLNTYTSTLELCSLSSTAARSLSVTPNSVISLMNLTYYWITSEEDGSQ